MTFTEHSSKTPRTMTGIFVVLGGLFRAIGSGALSVVLVGLGVFVFFATPALAGVVYTAPPTTFGSEGSGDGQFKGPVGVAVSEAAPVGEVGDVYVVDAGNNRIEQFGPTGTYVRQFDGAAAPTGALSNPQWVAVDNDPLSESKGDVYVTGEVQVAGKAHHMIYKFEADGTYLGQLPGSCENEGETPPSCADYTEFAGLNGVAVDPTGLVWVYQSSGEIDSFSDALANGFLSKRIDGSETYTPGFAVDSEDDLYVGQQEFVGINHIPEPIQIRELNSSGQFNAGLDQYGNAVAVDLSTNEVFVDEGGTVGRFDHTGGSIEKFGEGSLSGGYGLAVDAANGDVYVADNSASKVDAFEGAVIPGVESDPASNMGVEHGTVTATLNGKVNPEGLPVTLCEFEYGTSTSYGSDAPCERPDAAEIGSGTSPVEVHADLTGLRPDTTYHFRLRAANANDENDPKAQLGHIGGDETFATAGASILAEASPAEVKATTVMLSGEVNPGGLPLSECKFEYGTEGYRASVPCEQTPAEIGSGTGPVRVSAKLTGLLGGTTYRVRLAATDEVPATKETVAVTGKGQEFHTLPLAMISSGEASEVSAIGAQLHASVNPEGLQVDHCVFEYGTSTSYGETVKCAQKKSTIGAGTEFVPVGATLEALQPNTTYHWRLRVSDENGETFGVDHTFNYLTGGEGLPDNRAYEMVTPVHKNGALFGATFYGYPPQISEGEGPESLHQGSSRVIALTIQCIPGSESCTGLRAVDGEPFEFTRTSTGWVSTPLSPPSTQFSENTSWLVDADLGTALFSMPTRPAGEDEWYARSPEPEPKGTFSAIGPATPPGTSGVSPMEQQPVSATSDLSHLVWAYRSSHENPLWSFDNSTLRGSNEASYTLYEYAGAHTGSLNEKPFLVAVKGAAGSNELIGTCENGLGGATGSSGYRQNALSADGKTVYFTAQAAGQPDGECVKDSGGQGPPVNELYARVDGEGPGAHTVAISEPDAPQIASESVRGYQSPPDEECTGACVENIESPNAPTIDPNWRTAYFAGASEDGSKVFFTSEQQLVDTATQDSNNLYLYDFAAPAGHNLIDVSAGDASGLGPQVQGVVAVSADGSHVYFAAKGVLTSVPSPDAKGFGVHGEAVSMGATAQLGEDNLYVYDVETHHTTFIAALTEADEDDWVGLFPNVTPDGRLLVFGSHGDLAPGAHAGGNQIYRYDAANGELVRVSVGEDGFDDDGNAGVGNATIVPAFQAGSNDRLGSSRGDPTMSNNGAYVFFQSPLGLTPHALNDASDGHGYARNVYEWEAPGTEVDGKVVCAQAGGCVYLISDGRDAGTAENTCKVPDQEAGEPDYGASVCLLGTDASGHNVFFTTADRLVPADTDTQVDIYDARVCEPANGNPCIALEPSPLPPCGGEACHGIPAATPSLLAPGTASFNGEGNIAPTPTVAVKPKSLTRAQKLVDALKVCKRDKSKKKRSSCEKQARDRYGAKKTKKSTKANRRAAR
jgi:hypothetical protein